MSTPTVQPLVALGFTALEAEIYSFLLTEAPVTGYRVAQALRKPAPNIYKAIESLQTKGAVMVDEARSRHCRPVPPDELLRNLERRFSDQTKKAALALNDLSHDQRDDRVYQLRSPDQVLERCRVMLGRAEDVVLMDGFPDLLEQLRPDALACAERGVIVAVKAYEPIEIPGARVVMPTDRAATLERWPIQWITMVIDGSEHLVAMLALDGSEVYQAIWSGSVYLSWVYHSALSSELVLDAITEVIDQGGSAKTLRATLESYGAIKAQDSAGYRILTQQLGSFVPNKREA